MIRLYRLLLLLQPRDVRRRYGAEMEALVRLRAAEERPARFWTRELCDLAATTVTARRTAIGWVLVAIAVVHTAFAMAVYPVATMGMGAVLLTATALLGGTAIVARS